jgi:hypothetical protein
LNTHPLPLALPIVVAILFEIKFDVTLPCQQVLMFYY